MVHRIKPGLEHLIDHYTVLCLALALVILSLIGTGDVRITSLLGLLLCGTGMTQSSARTDPWILAPLILYDLAALASSYMTDGDIVDGYGTMHAVFPVIYLLMGCLNGEDLRRLKRCCVLWAGCAAVIGIGSFALRAVTQGLVGRMYGPLANSNTMGIFLVVGWFAVMHCVQEDRKQDRASPLLRLEPVLLIALALTLSMGSFLAMAVGIAVLLLEEKRGASRSGTFWYACRLLARAVLPVGTGILIYMAARTGVSWLCLLPLAFGAAAVMCWKSYERFLAVYPRASLVIAGLGILVAAAAVALRPNSIATFAERLEMMGSGLKYLTDSPLFGVGPFRWRLLDLNDGGKYFNTWHIHNVPLHIGVETGWPAMAMVVLSGLRALCKRKAPSLRSGTAAFLFHNLIDTSFFYLGATSLVLEAAGEPGSGGRSIGGRAVKTIFALFAGLFAYSLFRSV